MRPARRLATRRFVPSVGNIRKVITLGPCGMLKERGEPHGINLFGSPSASHASMNRRTFGSYGRISLPKRWSMCLTVSGGRQPRSDCQINHSGLAVSTNRSIPRRISLVVPPTAKRAGSRTPDGSTMLALGGHRPCLRRGLPSRFFQDACLCVGVNVVNANA